MTLSNLDDVPGAEVHARRALELNPNLAQAHATLAAAAELKGDLPSMLAAHQAAVALDPENPDFHFALSHSLLMTGNFLDGWREYEWRFKTRIDPSEAPKFSTAPWDGADIPGKTLLVHAEQGLGDAIQFARYLPILARSGIRVVLRCQPPLGDIMRTVEGISEVTTGKEALPRFDEHVPLLGLPHRLGTALDSIPQNVPYCFANDHKVNAWRARIKPTTRKRIGVAGAGNPRHPRDRQRSIDSALLAPLAQCQSVDFFSLQRDWRGPKPPLPMQDFTHELHDLSDTAALMSNLDLVISVDTSLAHLAGALGRPVWTLIAFAPDWRWMRDRSDTPWYPTMRLFRQPAQSDWPSVINQVRDALSSHPANTPRSCPP